MVTMQSRASVVLASWGISSTAFLKVSMFEPSGKTPRAGRKLGHVTLVDADDDWGARVLALTESAWSV